MPDLNLPTSGPSAPDPLADWESRRARSLIISRCFTITLALACVWRSGYYLFNAHKGFVNNNPHLWTSHIAFEAVAGVFFSIVALIGFFMPSLSFKVLEILVVRLVKAGFGYNELSSLWNRQKQSR